MNNNLSEKEIDMINEIENHIYISYAIKNLKIFLNKNTLEESLNHINEFMQNAKSSVDKELEKTNKDKSQAGASLVGIMFAKIVI